MKAVELDLSVVFQIVQDIADAVNKHRIIVNKITAPVGTSWYKGKGLVKIQSALRSNC